MKFELPELGYSKDALQPYMSAEQLEFHHDKHHTAYVKKLNDLLKDDKNDRALDDIIRSAGPGTLFNNAAQHWNHSFYWNCMKPRGGKPKGALADAVKRSFGGLDALQKQFNEAAAQHFGSGWAWLVLDGPGLRIETTHDADLPLAHGRIAILTCDVWEHAYYVDYRNERAKYLNAFWNVVNWDFVGANYERLAAEAQRIRPGDGHHAHTSD
jgi:superoxide dismutase, Fe-Mn family